MVMLLNQLVVINGNTEKAIPVVSADELIDWDMVDHEAVSFDNRRGNAFDSLSYRNDYYYNRYNPYGYNYRYYDYSPRYGVGLRSSRFGFNRGNRGVFYGRGYYRGRGY